MCSVITSKNKRSGLHYNLNWKEVGASRLHCLGFVSTLSRPYNGSLHEPRQWEIEDAAIFPTHVRARTMCMCMCVCISFVTRWKVSHQNYWALKPILLPAQEQRKAAPIATNALEPMEWMPTILWHWSRWTSLRRVWARRLKIRITKNWIVVTWLL